MPSPGDYFPLPADLPVPLDDGAARHLTGLTLPAIALPSTDGSVVNLGGLPNCTVLYIYPKTGVPGIALPEGWNEIPGARGCTPQSCAFRDHHAELTTLGASVFGLSAQGTGYQAELKSRLHLPFEILSDSGLLLMEALRLPVFVCDGETLYRRLTLIVEAGVIRKVFYPVFPPDRNAGDVLAWLRENR